MSRFKQSPVPFTLTPKFGIITFSLETPPMAMSKSHLATYLFGGILISEEPPKHNKRLLSVLLVADSIVTYEPFV